MSIHLLARRTAAAVTTFAILAFADPPSTSAATAAKYGSPHQDTLELSTDQQQVIADHMRECWPGDEDGTLYEGIPLLLTVTTDQDGVARKVELADNGEISGLSDFGLADLTERLTLMILDRQCEPLPLPSAALGRVSVISVPFSP
jgi:hypothetical protein